MFATVSVNENEARETITGIYPLLVEAMKTKISDIDAPVDHSKGFKVRLQFF